MQNSEETEKTGSPPSAPAPRIERSGGHMETPESLFQFFWHYRRRFILLVIFVLFVAFAIYDISYLHWPGIDEGWCRIGRHTTYLGNVRYALTPDRNELVVSYDLVTMQEGWLENSRFLAASRQAETRIPLDPMPDTVKRYVVDVVVDPNVEAVRYVGAERIGVSEWPPSFPVMGILVPDPEPEPRETRGGTQKLPDGPNCSLHLRVDDLPLLSGNFSCRIWNDSLAKVRNANGGHNYFSPTGSAVLIPYDRDGDRHVMLCAMWDNGPVPFYRQIIEEHPEINRITWDTPASPFRTWCGRILSLPLGLLEDFFFWGPLWLLLWFVQAVGGVFHI